jgi:hypothetical protein
MIFQFQIAGAKIAGALDSLAYDDDDSREGGFIVAALNARSITFTRASPPGRKLRLRNCCRRNGWKLFALSCSKFGRKFSL